MFEHIPLRKEECTISVNLWIGCGDKLTNYRGRTIERIEDVLFREVIYCIRCFEKQVIILVNDQNCTYNLSFDIHTYATINDIRDIIHNLIMDIKDKWTNQ